jgi:chromosome segregation ATPase
VAATVSRCGVVLVQQREARQGRERDLAEARGERTGLQARVRGLLEEGEGLRQELAVQGQAAREGAAEQERLSTRVVELNTAHRQGEQEACRLRTLLEESTGEVHALSDKLQQWDATAAALQQALQESEESTQQEMARSRLLTHHHHLHHY